MFKIIRNYLDFKKKISGFFNDSTIEHHYIYKGDRCSPEYLLWTCNGFMFFEDYTDSIYPPKNMLLAGLPYFYKRLVWLEIKREIKSRSFQSFDDAIQNFQPKTADINEFIKNLKVK